MSLGFSPSTDLQDLPNSGPVRAITEQVRFWLHVEQDPEEKRNDLKRPRQGEANLFKIKTQILLYFSRDDAEKVSLIVSN